MKNLILGLAFVGFLKNSFSQPTDYMPYYKAINEAELQVVELDFANAYKIYSQTFKEFGKPQRNDLYNASLCAILTGDTQQAKFWIKKLITMGFTLENFKAKTFKRLAPLEWEEIKADYDSLHYIYRSSLDLTYLAALDSLRAREQRLVSGEQCRYDSLLYVHAKLLHRMITERGIPSGFEYGGQPLPPDVMLHNFGLRNRLKYCERSGIDTTAKPYKSMNFRIYDLEPLLKDAIFKGELPPQFVVEWMSYSEIDSTRQYLAFGLDVNLNTRKITPVEPTQNSLKLVDSYRYSVGLESCRDAAKKDIRVALLYNQEKFPFDEFIRRFKEIGFTEKADKSFKRPSPEAQEFDLASIRVIHEITMNALKNDNVRLKKNNRDKYPIYIENKWELLKQFKLQSGIGGVVIDPL